MTEPVFLKHTSGLTLDEIAKLCGAELVAAPHARRIVDIAPLDRAGPSDLTWDVGLGELIGTSYQKA